MEGLLMELLGQLVLLGVLMGSMVLLSPTLLALLVVLGRGLAQTRPLHPREQPA